VEGRGSQATKLVASARLAGELFVLVLALLLSWGSSASSQELLDTPAAETEQIQALLRRSSTALAGVHDYRGTLVKRERFGEALLEQTVEFKFSRPFKVYVKYIEPHPGREVIYVRGDGSVHLSDGGTVSGHPTWRIEMLTKTGGRDVTVRGSENLWKLAKRVGQDMYVILHHNDDIHSPRDVRPGQTVFVPRYYGSRGEFFFSKRTDLIIKVVTWDQHGKLYESYEFTELELNPGLEDRDFDYRNEDYDFVSR
jgi:outer membrane lipoprotein-sorting protein